MNESYIKNVVEAAILAAGRPLQLAELAALFEEDARPSTAELRAALASLEEDYSSRGIELKETANGFRIQVRRQLANEISRLWPERPPRYSRALLETLALIAYRQPITRAEIEAVRGVAVNPNIIKTLLERNWVRVVGQRDVPGRPELLGTTKEFLDYFGLRSLDELPPLAELKAMGDVNLQLDLAKESTDGANGAAPASESSSSEPAGEAPASPEASSADGETDAASESVAGDPAGGDGAGPQTRAAEAFVESIDGPEATAGEEDSEEDELSASGSQDSSELVAAPRHFDD